MTNDKNTKWPIYLVISVILVLVIAAIITIITPKNVIIPPSETLSTNSDGSKTSFTDVVYTGENPNLPTKLPVAKTIRSTTTANYVTTQLINNLGLKERDDAIGVWNGPEYSLTKNNSENRYSLSQNHIVNILKDNDSNVKFNEETAIKAAEKFIDSLFPDLNLKTHHNNISYINTHGMEYESVSDTFSSSTTLVAVPFAPTIKNLPVYYKNNSGFPFQVTINNTNDIQKLVFYTLFTDFEVGNNIELISINKAIDNINNNLGSIVHTNYQGADIISLEKITSGEMNSVSLEYRVDEKIGLAYPYYRFLGDISIPSHSSLQVEIITPAVHITTTSDTP